MSLRNEVWTIPDNGTTSNAIQRGPDDIIGALVPVTNVQGTTFSFEGSLDGTNFYPILYKGTAVTITKPAAASIVTMPAEELHGPQWIRVASNASETSGPIVLTPLARRYF